MCFSATASFATAGLLLPIGAYCVKRAKDAAPRSLPFAIYPLAFGIQQVFEGTLWVQLDAQPELVPLSAYGFLLFSHFFWLLWVPFSVWFLEPAGTRRNVAFFLTVLGGTFGASLYLPIVINDGWLNLAIVHHSIAYQTTLIYDGLVPREGLRLFYALIVLTPLLMQSGRQVRHFGILLLLSVVFSKIAFDYAFISVWCFFAALLSPYIVFMLRKQAGHPRHVVAGASAGGGS